MYEKVHSIGSNPFKKCKKIKLYIYGNDTAIQIAKKYKYPYVVRKKNINSINIKVKKITSKTFTGKKIEPKPILKFGQKKLTLGKDYNIKYKNNINVGKGIIIIKGKNSYTGTRIITFKIKK